MKSHCLKLVNEEETKSTATGRSTRAVHSGERGQQQGNTVATPIHQTSTFWFRDSEELREYQEGRLKRDEYGRYGNPTWRAVEGKLADLENAEEAVLFSSGMCAATTLFLALLPQGGHLVVTSDCYRRTRQFCDEYLTKMGVTTTVVDPSDLEVLEQAISNDTDIFFTELPTNPFLRVIDLPEAVRIAHNKGAKVVVDSTFATPLNYRPLDDGADLVVHSATKYLGGHNDLLAGAVAGSADLINTIRNAVGVLGGVTGPQDAYFLLRGLKTVDLRMQRHNANACEVALMLENHPKVRRVYYPGLPSHPDHEVAKRLLTGFGGVVTFEIEGDFDAAVRFIDRCDIPYIAPSLGGVESLVEMPVLMSYWDIPPEKRLELGISDTLVRYSCGIEDASDLLDDLRQALSVV
jgi:cystathionine gamma-synthase